jgi:hypothetical protein
VIVDRLRSSAIHHVGDCVQWEVDKDGLRMTQSPRWRIRARPLCHPACRAEVKRVVGFNAKFAVFLTNIAGF